MLLGVTEPQARLVLALKVALEQLVLERKEALEVRGLLVLLDHKDRQEQRAVLAQLAVKVRREPREQRELLDSQELQGPQAQLG